MKTIYLVRNSDVLYNAFSLNYSKDSKQVWEEKMILSCTGEENACMLSNLECLKSVDYIYSSNYVSALETAKYIARANNIKINIDDNFGERKIGKLGDIDYETFYIQQFKDFDYKLYGGESVRDVKSRMSGALKRAINTDGEKKVIVTHQDAILCLLLNWCVVEFNCENSIILSFNDEIIYDGCWNSSLVFELIFDDEKKLVKINKK